MLGVRVQFGVLVDVVAIDHDERSFWDDFTRGQFETFRVGDDTRDVDLKSLVCVDEISFGFLLTQ